MNLGDLSPRLYRLRENRHGSRSGGRSFALEVSLRMSILEICQWLQTLGWATSIRESILMFPVLEGSHLLGIAVMLAPTFLLDIRLLGWGWKGDSVRKIAYTFLP